MDIYISGLVAKAKVDLMFSEMRREIINQGFRRDLDKFYWEMLMGHVIPPPQYIMGVDPVKGDGTDSIHFIKPRSYYHGLLANGPIVTPDFLIPFGVYQYNISKEDFDIRFKSIWSFTKGPISIDVTKGSAWVRLFGYGLSIKDTTQHEPLFSERYGYTKHYRIGKYSITILKK